MNILLLLLFFVGAKTDPLKPIDDILKTNNTSANTRRILGGHEITDTRPYMVYLRPAVAAEPSVTQTNWLCGGVIVHDRYIVTSAACIEDAKQFYVVSGTHRWVPPGEKNNECVNNGAKKAIWKCVPKSEYVPKQLLFPRRGQPEPRCLPQQQQQPVWCCLHPAATLFAGTH